MRLFALFASTSLLSACTFSGLGEYATGPVDAGLDGAKDGGSDGPKSVDTGGGGGHEASASCSLHDTRCVGNDLEACGTNGQWGSPSSCGSQFCVEVASRAACVECLPASSRCAGNGVETCSSIGKWGPSAACAGQTCVETSSTIGTTAGCEGSCAPAQTRCDTAMTGVQTCGAGGTWGNATPCTGSTCVMGDGGSSASCGGDCLAGQATCSGNSVETCTAGSFGNAQPCGTMTCITTGGVAACTGMCTPGTYRCGTGNEPQECNSSGMWEDSANSCSNSTCVADTTGASCVGTCVSGNMAPCGNCNLGSKTCGPDGTYDSCLISSNACTPGSTASCTTCGSLPGFASGTETCSASCAGGDCYPPTGTNWSINGNPSTGFTHVCGSSLFGTDWYYAEQMGGNYCELQAGPNATLSAGNYTATFTIASACNSGSCPAQGTSVGSMQVSHGPSAETTDVSMNIPLGTNSPVTYSLPFTVAVDCTTQYTFRVFANFPSGAGFVLDITGTSLTYNGP